jgi:23S rRNA pseudouridine2605 synthase
MRKRGHKPGEKIVRDMNRDRIRSRKQNEQEREAHLKDMARRMGVAPAQKKSDNAQDGERLHVRIAHSGLCSRRAAERLIQEGRVTVNGEIVIELGTRVSPGDQVRVDGQPIGTAKQYTLVVYKPTGMVTTLSDPQGRRTIAHILPDYGVQLKPVGRLDMETEGLLLVTNDGELAHRLSHPRYGIEKEYQAIVRGITDEKALEQLRKGVYFEGRKSAPAKVEVIRAEPKTNSTGLRITIHEGRKRQVRLMCEAVGHPVISLKRVRLGPLVLKGMRSGEAKLLGQKDVNKLRELVGLPPAE